MLKSIFSITAINYKQGVSYLAFKNTIIIIYFIDAVFKHNKDAIHDIRMLVLIINSKVSRLNF